MDYKDACERAYYNGYEKAKEDFYKGTSKWIKFGNDNFCLKCGQFNHDMTKYCPNCGSFMEEDPYKIAREKVLYKKKYEKAIEVLKELEGCAQCASLNSDRENCYKCHDKDKWEWCYD